jgi:hypothetical protein
MASAVCNQRRVLKRAAAHRVHVDLESRSLPRKTERNNRQTRGRFDLAARCSWQAQSRLQIWVVVR